MQAINQWFPIFFELRTPNFLRFTQTNNFAEYFFINVRNFFGIRFELNVNFGAAFPKIGRQFK